MRVIVGSIDVATAVVVSLIHLVHVSYCVIVVKNLTSESFMVMVKMVYEIWRAMFIKIT